eukprot:545192-Prymnesium_polylepis.1
MALVVTSPCCAACRFTGSGEPPMPASWTEPRLIPWLVTCARGAARGCALAKPWSCMFAPWLCGVQPCGSMGAVACTHG